jgi:formylglycine-generating enzyme required for sulfatase activity
MRRYLQHPLTWCPLLAGGLALLALSLSPAADLPKLPVVEPLAIKGYTEKLADSDVSFDMVPVPGGKFLMGSPKDEPGRKEDEGPQHPVEIKPFWMGKCEVTWDEYDLYWKKEEGPKSDKDKKDGDKDKPAADAITRPTPPYADETFGHGREGMPVLCITWHAANEYCRWLSKKTGKVYRLPTEAEWEWACRAGTTTAYSWGDDPKKAGDYAWFEGNAEEDPHKVGTKKPNPWGLYDMHGNVMEWCLDQYRKDFYSTLPTDKLTLEPVNLPGPDRFPHVARGGSWDRKADALRSAARVGSNKDWIKLDPQRPQSIWWLTSADFVGFRVICPVEEQESLKGFRSKVTRESK